MYHLSLFLAFCLVLTTIAGAATQQWIFDGDDVIRQVIADGKGGCAVVTQNTNGFPSITWLDKNGDVRYQETWSEAITVYIVKCSKKMLLYGVDSLPSKFFHVDKKGVNTTISDGSNDLNSGIYASVIPVNCMADKKGFFTILIDLADGTQKLVRFSRK